MKRMTMTETRDEVQNRRMTAAVAMIFFVICGIREWQVYGESYPGAIVPAVMIAAMIGVNLAVTSRRLRTRMWSRPVTNGVLSLFKTFLVLGGLACLIATVLGGVAQYVAWSETSLMDRASTITTIVVLAIATAVMFCASGKISDALSYEALTGLRAESPH